MTKTRLFLVHESMSPAVCVGHYTPDRLENTLRVGMCGRVLPPMAAALLVWYPVMIHPETGWESDRIRLSR